MSAPALYSLLMSGTCLRVSGSVWIVAAVYDRRRCHNLLDSRPHRAPLQLGSSFILSDGPTALPFDTNFDRPLRIFAHLLTSR